MSELDSPKALEEDPLMRTVAPIPKTPRNPPKESGLNAWLSFSLERKNCGNSPDDSGWQQNQFKAFELGGTATCKPESHLHNYSTDKIVCPTNQASQLAVYVLG